jgi:hypothetical protein
MATGIRSLIDTTRSYAAMPPGSSTQAFLQNKLMGGNELEKIAAALVTRERKQLRDAQNIMPEEQSVIEKMAGLGRIMPDPSIQPGVDPRNMMAGIMQEAAPVNGMSMESPGGVAELPVDDTFYAADGGIIGFQDEGLVPTEDIEYYTSSVPGIPSGVREPKSILEAQRDLERAELYAGDEKTQFFVDRLQKQMEGMSTEDKKDFLQRKKYGNRYSRDWETGPSPEGRSEAVGLLEEKRQPDIPLVPEWAERIAGRYGFGDVVQKQEQPILSVEGAKGQVKSSIEQEIQKLREGLSTAPDAKVSVIQARIAELEKSLKDYSPSKKLKPKEPKPKPKPSDKKESNDLAEFLQRLGLGIMSSDNPRFLGAAGESALAAWGDISKKKGAAREAAIKDAKAKLERDRFRLEEKKFESEGRITPGDAQDIMALREEILLAPRTDQEYETALKELETTEGSDIEKYFIFGTPGTAEPIPYDKQSLEAQKEIDRVIEKNRIRNFEKNYGINISGAAKGVSAADRARIQNEVSRGAREQNARLQYLDRERRKNQTQEQ